MDHPDEALLEEVMAHLDREVGIGAMRMSVGTDDARKEHSVVSHKCCKAYGMDASETVARLDMYSDLYLSNGEN